MFVIGLMMIFSPIIFFFMDGGDDDGDFITWIGNKPLNFIFIVEGCLVFGFLMVTIGLAQSYWSLL